MLASANGPALAAPRPWDAGFVPLGTCVSADERRAALPHIQAVLAAARR